MSSSNKGEPETVISAEIGDPERRRHLRFPFSATAEVTETKSGAKIAGRTSDLGLGGCYVDAISAFPLGADTRVRIDKGDEIFEAQAKVVYSQIGMGMGLAFVSAQPKHYRLFQEWLREINGSAPVSSEAREEDSEELSAGASDETSNVLNELLIALIRKRVLTEPEGKALLKKLHR